VVLYSRDGNWTHASRIVGLGKEYSKFGYFWDATHGHDKFTNTYYGSPYKIMKRPKDVYTPPRGKGTIKIDLSLLDS